jgi:hypothetical protein
MSTSNPASTTSQPIFLFLSEEAQELVDDNSINLVQELTLQGLEVKPGQAADPVARPGTKDVCLVILAAASAVPFVASGIAKVIDGIGRNKQVLVTNHRCTAVRDQHGQPCLDQTGKPIMEWTETHELLTPGSRPDISQSVEARFLGVSVSLKDAERTSSKETT